MNSEFDVFNTSYACPVPTRKARLETYLYDNYMPSSSEIAAEFAEQKPIEKTVVAIPVAAHQESDTISTTLEQYSRQVNADPFSICLFLNYPSAESNNPNIQKAVNTVAIAQEKYADSLDIRMSLQAYHKPVIGAIRKDLWDAVGLLALHEGLYDDPNNDIIMINNDIDSEYISTRYIASIQKAYKASQLQRNAIENMSNIPLPVRSTQVRHNLRFDTHPHTSGGIFWNDLIHRMAQDAGMSSGYEAGLVVPLATYAKEGGFDRKSITHETEPLHGSAKLIARGIRDTALKTSPRRYIEKFPVYGYDIWSDKTFGAEDACRVENDTVHRDATREELDAVISKSMEWSNDWIMTAGLHRAIHKVRNFGRGLERAEKLKIYEQEINGHLRLAKKALQSIVDSPSHIARLPGEDAVRDLLYTNFKAVDSLEYL